MVKRKKTQKQKQRERRYKQGLRHAAEQPDFLRRTKYPNNKQLIICAGIAFAVIVGATLQMEKIGGPATLVTISACVFMLGVALAVITLDQLHGIIFSNEFETALFAGAAVTGSEFFLIAKRNRQVIYVSPSFNSLFGAEKDGEAAQLGGLLDGMGVEAEQRDRILLALIARGTLDIYVSIKPQRSPRSMMRLMLDPIGRPGGYFVLRGVKMDARGRSKHERAGLEDITASVEQLMEEVPCGIYKVSAGGIIQQVNPAFEAMLGYSAGELLMHYAKFTEIVHEGFQETPFHQRWEGNIAFKGRGGEPVRLLLKQVLIEGEGEKEASRLGFVLAPTMVSSTPNPRKKS